MSQSLDIVLLGLSITSSRGNGHATTYQGLVRELAARGHRVLFPGPSPAERERGKTHSQLPCRTALRVHTAGGAAGQKCQSSLEGAETGEVRLT